MKFPRFRPLLLAAVFAIPALAHAHPGHDGDHDFVWDYAHLAAHPLATVLCAMVLTVGAWNVWLFLRSRRAKTQSAGIRRNARR
jgi:hypothetical protein